MLSSDHTGNPEVAMWNRYALYLGLLLSPVFAGCGSTSSNEPQVPAPVPQMSITDSTLPADDRLVAFGTISTAAATTATQTVTITNLGSADLNIPRVAQLDPVTPPFSMVSDSCTGQTLGYLGQCTLTIGLGLSAPGTFADTFNIDSNDTLNRSVTVRMSGQVQ
jgi:hypothetical protein